MPLLPAALEAFELHLGHGCPDTNSLKEGVDFKLHIEAHNL